jgi:hypothetical protein
LHDDVTPDTKTLINSYSSSESNPGTRKMEGDREHNCCLGKESMPTLEEQLEIWIIERCRETGVRVQQFDGLNSIFRDIYKDRRFWRYRDYRYPDDYEEALCLMWQYFVRNLCEAETARERGPFLDTCSFAVPRLLESLKGNLKNLWEEPQKALARLVPTRFDSAGNPIDPLEQFISPEPEPESEHDPVEVWKVFLELLEKDPTGELNASTNTLKGITKTTEIPYVLSAQTYLLMKHRDQMTIHQIADTLDIRLGSVQGGVKPSRWKELARKYAQMAKDLASGRGG